MSQSIKPNIYIHFCELYLFILRILAYARVCGLVNGIHFHLGFSSESTMISLALSVLSIIISISLSELSFYCLL